MVLPPLQPVVGGQYKSKRAEQQVKVMLDYGFVTEGYSFVMLLYICSAAK
jgi:hypothetical protein